MDINKQIYYNVKMLAKKEGMNLGEVEKQIGISQGYLSRLKCVSAEVVVKLSKLFEVPIEDLMTKDMGSSIQKEELTRRLDMAVSTVCGEDDAMKLMIKIVRVINDYFDELEEQDHDTERTDSEVH